MALDIGLHLLGGDPHGFWAQPRPAQLDLLAYWQLMQEREGLRWATMGPARLADLALHTTRSGWAEVVSGLKAWLGANGVRFRKGPERAAAGQMQNALHMANARRCGASPSAVKFWLGG